MRIELIRYSLPEPTEARYVAKEGESFGRIIKDGEERPLLVIKDEPHRAIDIEAEIAKRSNIHYLQSKPYSGAFLTELIGLYYYSIHGERPRYVPEGYDFALIVTGDVDFLRYSLRKNKGALFRHIKLDGILFGLRRFRSYLSRRSLAKTIERVCDYIGKITIFRLPKDGTRYTSDYTRSDVPETSCERGLHAPIAASVLGEPLKKYITEGLLGSRSHYLKLSEKLLRELEELGFLYDATLGFPASNKPRGALSPFYIYLGKRKTRLVEINHTYSDISYSLGYPIEPLFEEAKRYAGVVTINRHPRFLREDDPDYYESLYKIIDYAERKNARITNAIDYVKRFTSRYRRDTERRLRAFFLLASPLA